MIVQPKDRAQVMKIISGSYDACFSSLAAVLRQDSKDSKDVHANGFDDDGRKVNIISISWVQIVDTRPLDSWAASSAACRQGKKDIGRSRKKEKEKKGRKEEEDKDLIKGEMMVEEKQLKSASG